MNHTCEDHLVATGQWTVGPQHATARFACSYDGCANRVTVRYDQTSSSNCIEEDHHLLPEAINATTPEQLNWEFVCEDCDCTLETRYERTSMRLEPPYLIGREPRTTVE